MPNDGLTRRDLLASGAAAVSALAARALPLGGAAEAVAGAPTSPVDIRRCGLYEPGVVAEQISAALNSLGGIPRLVAGKTVTVKLNLTGSGEWICGLPASRSYQVHPHVVAALCAVLARHGARRIVLGESMYFREPPEQRLAEQGWDVSGILAAGQHRVVFENTRNRGAWKRYARLPVPRGGLLYPAFEVNQRYDETDVLVSLAKLKEHSAEGFTGTVKNLFGILPMSLYGNDAADERSTRARFAILHDATREVPSGVPPDHGAPRLEGRPAWQSRVPRVIADCLGARPVDLAIIDGIETVAGGEGPWVRDLRPVAPRLLFAGRNAVCTDAIAMAVIGLDPAAAPPYHRFGSDNHLRLAAEAGLGSNDLQRIEVRGLGIGAAFFPFLRAEAHGRTFREIKTVG